MPLELEVALAYLRSRPSRLVSAVSLLAIGGIALGVAALVVAMGLLSGYRDRDPREADRRQRGGRRLPARLRRIRGRSPRCDGGSAARAAGPAPPLRSSTSRGWRPRRPSPDGVDAVLKGIDGADEARVSPQMAAICPTRRRRSPRLPGEPARRGRRSRARAPARRPRGRRDRALRARRVAGRPSLRAADRTVPRGPDLPDELRRVRRRVDLLRPRGAAGARPDARRRQRRRGQARHDARTSRRRLRRSARPRATEFSVTDTLSMNGGLFSALKVQQTTLFLVIGLIVAVSTFNVVATLVMTVQEKKRDIGVLVGARRRARHSSRACSSGSAPLARRNGGRRGRRRRQPAICWVDRRPSACCRFPPGVAEIYFVSFIPFLVRAARPRRDRRLLRARDPSGVLGSRPARGPRRHRRSAAVRVSSTQSAVLRATAI